MIDIDKEIANAIKEKDTNSLKILRLLKSQIVNAEKQDGKAIDEAKKIKIIQKMISDCKEDAETYKKAGRDGQAEEELRDAFILDRYLPSLPEDYEVIESVKNAISNLGHEVSMKDMKAIRDYVFDQYPLADGKLIANTVRECIYSK